MVSLQEKAQCVLWYHETKSPVAVQRKFRNEYRRDPPDVKRIKDWYKKFTETGSVEDRKRSGRPSVSDASVDAVRDAFQRSPRKSVRRASIELRMPRSTVHKVLHKRLRLRAYKVQLVQELKPHDRPQREAFATEILSRIDEDNDYLKHVVFSDEATFHTCGKVNRHNVRIWGSEHPHVAIEHERNSPKVNVWCGLMHDRVIGPFFFAEPTISAITYLDMLEHYAAPQLEQFQPRVLFQQDGAPPRWGLVVRNFLDATFPNRWIGRDGPTKWPPRSPDITPLDFFLWGYIKDKVYSTPVPNVETLKARVTAAVATVTMVMLENTWREIEFRLDVLRATKGAHVEIYE